MSLEDLCYLALGELGMGTKAYDPKAMEGLAFFLETNGYKIDHMIVDSGLLPLVPSYYGLSNAKNMRFLGTDKDKEPNSRAELALKSGLEEKDKEYIEKFVLQKITSKEQAATYAKKEFEKLLSVLGKVELHYLHGEEDRKNIEALEELKINDYMRIEKNKENLEEKLTQTTKEIVKREEELEEINREKKLLQLARKYLRSGNHKKNIEQFIESKSSEFDELEKGDSQRLQKFLRKTKSVGDVKNKLEEIYSEIKELNSEIRYNEKAVRDCKININAIEREKEASGFFRITKRQHIQPDEEEILYRLAKKEYNDLLYTIFPKTKFHVHSDNYVDLEIEGRTIRVYHSANLNGDSPVTNSLARIKKENNRANKAGEEVPDVVLCAHGKGGFRFQPQSKETENTIRGESRETPSIVMDMKLPTFQSYEILEWAKKKGIKNWHTKRYESKNYASGAVIHRIKKNGVQEVEYIDTKDLIKYGEIKKEIEELKTKRQTKKIQLRIEELVNSVKLDVRKIEASGDMHIGCPNVPGRPSNYDIIEASQKYQEKEMPSIVVTSEVLHGTLEKIFSSNKQYFSEVPKRREDLEKKILSDKNLNSEEKLEALQKLYKTQHEAIPITANSLAKMETKRRVIPYLEKILEQGGKVVLVSGNHYNCSAGDDEAYELATMFDLKYIDNGQVQIFDGLGAKFGSGTMRIDGKKLYSAHKPHNGTDEIAGAMKQILSANIDSDIIIFFDRHHTGGGYADDSAFVAAPGMQPWNKYVDAIGKYPGLRGIVNLHYDPKKRYYKWEFVLDPTLEAKK